MIARCIVVSVLLAHMPRLCVNLWGHLTGSFGLGEGARATARALVAAGVRVQCRDLPLATHANDTEIEQTISAGVEPGDFQPAAIDLIHTNPNILSQTNGLSNSIELTAPLRIGYWAWELESFPHGWEPGFTGLDQLWCPSSFTATSLGLRSPVPVTPLPHLPDWSRANRIMARRNQATRPCSSFTCLFAFDFWSTIGRKNPYGVIEAFQRAFPLKTTGDLSISDARLLLKAASGKYFPEATEELRRCCAADPRISLITEALSVDAVDDLYAAADVLISLHRAEGFGLGLAEAMAAEIPVIATGYSGNLDFMPLGSAELIAFKLVPIAHSEGDYRAGRLWADPDLDAAAAALRRLASDPAYRQGLALAGRKAVQERLAAERLAGIVSQRLGCLLLRAGRAELLAALPRHHQLRQLE
jgi:glycosyltransferase involved in cell wall biosynthesis